MTESEKSPFVLDLSEMLDPSTTETHSFDVQQNNTESSVKKGTNRFEELISTKMDISDLKQGPKIIVPLPFLSIKTLSFWVGTLCVGCIVGYGLYVYLFFQSSLSLITTNHDYVTTIDTYRQYLLEHSQKLTASIVGSQEIEAFTGSDIQQIIDSPKNFLSKKDIASKLFKSYITTISSTLKNIETTKKNIGTYGFIPLELHGLVQENSLWQSLLALEGINFTTSLQLYGSLGSFIKEFSTFTSVDPKNIEAQMAYYTSRGEKDINVYLITCFFNPFENNLCNNIGDFNNYYLLNNQDKEFKPNFFKTLLNYLINKSESNPYPNINVTLNTLNPQSKEVSFSIDVNTFQEDEAELTAKGILNPHIYIVGKLLELMRKSHFILGDAININNIKIINKKVRIGGEDINLRSSTLNLNVPIQQESTREIFDENFTN